MSYEKYFKMLIVTFENWQQYTIIMHCMANNRPSCGPTRSNDIFMIFHTVTTFHQ